MNVSFEITSYSEPMTALIAKVKDLEINSRPQALQAVDYIAEARSLLDAIEDKRKELTKKEREFVAKIDNDAKLLVETLKSIQTYSTEKLDAWVSCNKECFLEDKEIDWVEAEIMLPDLCESARLITSKAFVIEKEKTNFSITNMTLIPREYLKVDDKKLKLLVKAGIREIPGLSILKTKQLEIRRHARTR